MSKIPRMSCKCEDYFVKESEDVAAMIENKINNKLWMLYNLSTYNYQIENYPVKIETNNSRTNEFLVRLFGGKE